MKSYLFDVDGTLTEPMKKMDESFVFEFLTWMEGKSVFIVSGSNIEKIQKQLPSDVLDLCDGIFCSMANEFWQGGNLIYRNEFEPDIWLTEELIRFQMYTPFPVRVKRNGRGDIIERRPGMINFAPIGRNADMQERERYYEWDQKNGERARVAKQIERKFPALEARIGGQISVDIQPRGHNKSQATKWIRKNIGGEMTYFGDKCFEGGNDYDVVLDLAKHKDGVFFQIKNHKETRKLLACDGIA
jgi:phosphomannomutase